MQNITWLCNDTAAISASCIILPKLWQRNVTTDIYALVNNERANSLNDFAYKQNFYAYFSEKDEATKAVIKEKLNLFESLSSNSATLIKSADTQSLKKNILPEGDAVIISICLEEGDFSKIISDEAGVPLSIELCKKLTDKGQQVFLYVDAVMPDVVLTPWKEKYNSLYGASKEPEVILREGKELLSWYMAS